MQNTIEQNQEELTDQEKLQQVKTFIDDVRTFGLTSGKRTIKQGNTELKILDGSGDDTGTKIHFYLEKNKEKVFEFNLDEASSLREGKDRTTGVTMTINGKTMSYSGNYYDEHGIYNNFHLLDGAKKYLNEAQDILALDKAKREKEQEINKSIQPEKKELNQLKSKIN